MCTDVAGGPGPGAPQHLQGEEEEPARRAGGRAGRRPQVSGDSGHGATQRPMWMVTVTVEIASGCPRKETQAPSI